ncbi:glycosyltransferase family 2 protein [Coraliomargarita parva]|uniref:glycosyltransferase family 2 protein n=1 Tax=Coraliomargarita parva TaxID=3014050 RepID=UPI0022B3585E|nr:glycosyltransferase family 2 protein [Coraliomargarita parva]
MVVPLKDEAEGLKAFVATLQSQVSTAADTYECIFVDDGSQDETWRMLKELARSELRFKLLRLSRNFGKDAALKAGLDAATGRAIIVIDADFQDPPHLINEMVERWRNGAEVVTPVRRNRKRDSWCKRTSSKWFYKAFNRIADSEIPENAGDFRLFDRKILDALAACPEKNRFHKGLFNWVGYRNEYIEFDRPERAAGSSRWSYWRLWNYALDGIVGFSSAPLKISSYLGLVIAFGAFVYGLYLVVYTLLFGRDVPGYASIMVVLLFLGGLNLLAMGIIGQYLAQIFQEVKARPSYFVAEHVNVTEKSAQA